LENLEEMDKFLDEFNLPKLNQEDTSYLSRSVTSNEIEEVIVSAQGRIQDQMDLLLNLTRPLKN
jgi:hypothetical protein